MILGLLVGGVLSGKSLIKAAQLRAVVKEREQFVVAIRSFREKYFSLPGDMNNATQFWGQNTDTGLGCRYGSSPTSISTCDGDGDGKIGYQESQSAWKQLVNSQLVAGDPSIFSSFGKDVYTLVCSGGTATRPNNGCPPSKFGNNTGWYVGYYGTQGYTGSSITGLTTPDEYGHSLIFLYILQSAAGFMQPRALTPTEAYSTDTKLDDSKPGSGMVRSLSSSLCVDSTTDPANPVYLMSSTTARCALYFTHQF